VGVELRPPVRDDAEAIAALLNEHGERIWGAHALTPAVVEHWFEDPAIDPALDMVLAEAGGQLVGYADVGDGGADKTRFWIDLRTLDETAGHALLAHTEARARERAAEGALARGFFGEPDDLARRIFGERGYELVRRHFRMERSLDGELEAPTWPDGLDIRSATEADLERVWLAVQEAFADHWEHRPRPFEDFLHFANEPDGDLALWFLAFDGDEIAGACLCSPHEWGERDAGHVNSLSVRRPWRRHGLGLAFLLHAFRELQARGLARVTLGVDAENTTGAVRLYERAGMWASRRYDTVDRPLD
jgi:mycothiol synthase